MNGVLPPPYAKTSPSQLNCPDMLVPRLSHSEVFTARSKPVLHKLMTSFHRWPDMLHHVTPQIFKIQLRKPVPRASPTKNVLPLAWLGPHLVTSVVNRLVSLYCARQPNQEGHCFEEVCKQSLEAGKAGDCACSSPPSPIQDPLA